MKFEFKELSEKRDILSTYRIYKDCMYMPTEEKFNKKAEGFLKADNVKILACLSEQEIKGVVVASFLETGAIRIIGIAVELSSRKAGVGSYMVKRIMNDFMPSSIIAETDIDAVGFYKKCGFNVVEFTENYGGESVVRYKCELKR